MILTTGNRQRHDVGPANAGRSGPVRIVEGFDLEPVAAPSVLCPVSGCGTPVPRGRLTCELPEHARFFWGKQRIHP